MTVEIQYAPYRVLGDGATSEFTFPFSLSTTDSIQLFWEDLTTGVWTEIPSTEYTVSSMTLVGGTVTYLPATGPINPGQPLWISRSTANTQETSSENQTRYNASIAERVWDKLTHLIQELRYSLTTTLRTTTSLNPIVPEINKTIYWDGSNFIPGPTLSEVSSAASSAATATAAAAAAVAARDTTLDVVDGLVAAVKTLYIGDGVTMAFTLPFAINVQNQLDISIDGINIHSNAFTAVGTTLTLGEPPSVGAEIEITSRILTSISEVDISQILQAGATVGFSTRALLVSWAGSNTPPVGTIMGGAGFLYCYDGVSTLIPDMQGWKPASAIPNVEHFGDGPDWGEAIMNAFGYTHVRHIGDGITSTFTLPLTLSSSAEYFAVRIDGMITKTWITGGTPGAGQYAGSGNIVTFAEIPTLNAKVDLYCRFPGAASRSVVFGSKTYETSFPLVIDRGRWIGNRHVSRIQGISASFPKDGTLLDLGEFTHMEGFSLGFDTLDGDETEYQRVGLAPYGFRFGMQKGDVARSLFFNRVGTAVSDLGLRGFSVQFGDIRVLNFSYAVIDFQNATGTGNLFTNIYGTNSDENPAAVGYETYTPAYGVKYVGNNQGGAFTQLNIEHASFTTAMVWMEGAIGLSINNIHLEGCRLTGVSAPPSGRHWMYFENCLITGNALIMINMHMYHVDTKVIVLGPGGMSDAGSWAGNGKYAVLDFGIVNVKGLASPEDSANPGLYSELVGLENVTNFELIGRYNSTRRDYKVNFPVFDFSSYSARSAEVPIIRYADMTNSNRALIEFTNFDGRGTQVVGRHNLIKNGDFADWAAGVSFNVLHSGPTSLTCADGWTVFTGAALAAGDITVTQENADPLAEWAYFLRFDVNGIDKFQGLLTSFPGSVQMWSQALPDIDRYVTLSYWARGEAAGAYWKQIQLQRIIGAGGSGGVGFTNFAVNPVYTTSWKFYTHTILMPDYPAMVLGTNERMELRFAMNTDPVNAVTGYLDLANVKLEFGESPTAFRRMN